MKGDPVGVAISVSASDVAVADLTIRDVGYHAVQVRGERDVARFVLHNARLLDTGQQLLKVSTSDGHYAGRWPGGLLGLQLHGERTQRLHERRGRARRQDWVIRDNHFARIRGPVAGRWSAGPTILVWLAAQNTLVERKRDR
jgi:hypothetical protein